MSAVQPARVRVDYARVHVTTDDVIGICIFATIAVGAGVGLWLARRSRRGPRHGATPRVPIAELTPGVVARIEGRVVLDEIVESPLLRSRCAYWRLQVSYREHSTSQQGMVWYQSIAREARRDFRLRDATGTVRVAGTSAGFELLPVTHREPDLPEHMAQFLASQGVPLTTERGTPRVFGFEEWVLAEGAEVQVSGRVLDGPDGPVIGGPNVPAWVKEEGPDWA